MGWVRVLLGWMGRLLPHTRGHRQATPKGAPVWAWEGRGMQTGRTYNCQGAAAVPAVIAAATGQHSRGISAGTLAQK
jgi:hypothetical protein